MPRPDINIVAEQLKSAQEQRAAWAELTHLQRLAQVARYRAMQRTGAHIHHPFATPIGELNAPYSAAA